MRFQKATPMRFPTNRSTGSLNTRGGQGRNIPKRSSDFDSEVNLETLPVVAGRRGTPISWGPLTRMGTHLRVQAVRGTRAAVIELKPGLYLVAEVPEQSLRPEFGVIPLLAPLLTMAASRALRRRMQPEPAVAPPVQQPIMIVQAQPYPQATMVQPDPRNVHVPAVYPAPQQRMAVPVRWADPNEVETVVSGMWNNGGWR
jgi:hypothetical protein